MSTDKLLSRIQIQINELAPALELFIDETIQPSVQDCEDLQRLLVAIQENLAVYKYNKQNKELSPSFNIHARLSEKEGLVEQKAEAPLETKAPIIPEKEEKQITKVLPATETKPEVPAESPKQESINQPKPKSPLTIGINDKFRFMNELFAQNSSEYNIALEQINNLSNWSEAEIYLNSLKSVYEWDPKEESVAYFYQVVKKRFD